MDIELIVNQRGDKFVGVVFGEKLEETLLEAKDRVQNPPKLNIIVPVAAKKEENVEGVGYTKYKLIKIIDGIEQLEKIDCDGETDRYNKIHDLLEQGYRWISGENTTNIGVYKIREDKFEKITASIIVKIKNKTDKTFDGYLAYEQDGMGIPIQRAYIINPSEFFSYLGFKGPLKLDANQEPEYYYLTKNEKKHEIDIVTVNSHKLDNILVRDFYDSIKSDYVGSSLIQDSNNKKILSLQLGRLQML